MKLFPVAVFVLIASAAALPPCRAADAPTSSQATNEASARQTPYTGGEKGTADLAALEQFLTLSDAELAQMADAIARVRAMTPAQKEQLRKEIVAFRQLPPQQRQQLRQGWGWMPPEIQNGWREMMQHATPERRAEIQAKLQSLGPAEKTEYRRQLVEEYLKKK